MDPIIDILASEIDKLDKETYLALLELISNMDIIELLLQNKKISEEKLNEYIHLAIHKNCPFVHVLLLYKKHMDKT